MASFSIARPGKVSERQYLGDLACLFDRQRRRSGLALTLDSFASDLAASDSLRSGLFTLCNAISRMAEQDLSPEELLGLAVRALDGAGSAEGENGAEVPADMRAAFLSGYEAWRSRDTLSLADAREMEGRVSSLGAQLSSAAREGMRQDRPVETDAVIPFPVRRAADKERHEDDPRRTGFDLDLLVRRDLSDDARPASAAPTDERPRGIDALVAAATVWASAIPLARPSNADSVPARAANLSPSRGPSAVYAADTAAPSAPAATALAQAPTHAPVSAQGDQAGAVSLTPDAKRNSPSLAAKIVSFMLHLPPYPVFLVLATLTLLASGLAGFMAYRTTQPIHMPRFQDFERANHVDPVSPANVPTAGQPSTPASSPTPAAFPSARAGTGSGSATARASAASAAAPEASAMPAHHPPAGVRPSGLQQLTSGDAAATAAASSAAQFSQSATPQAAPAEPLYVPAPTMIGYALASPQPSRAAALVPGISGTVAVDLTISRLGNVTSAHAVSGPPELYAVTVAAVRRWRFRPYVVDGKPAEVSTTLQFYFSGN